jgi:hypothetical protein
VFALEHARQWLFTRLGHNAFPHPLPELRLCGPELLSIPTNHERGLPLPFFLLVNSQLDTPPALHGLPDQIVRKSIHTQNPVGKPLSRGSIKLSNGR